ncbi:TPA: heme uptake protein IsdC [Bacillus pacificus]|uniref:Iron-regulated surface determinant protein C n=1 Tax=Bacillus pacificus TaxID=2026187 RepID=A0A1Y5ZEE0_9BACI|nr:MULTISPECIES: heme uptake protein IsdC [Bacillus cereus group]AFQ10400.1 LPXTG-motif cell wall anchor domain protein, putative [Bacillus cereus FRI-35]PEB05000.1 heme uptake protein IsdC [Bacillus cereus]MCU5066342.1 heme uptake protein IsdC [Bacillus pacificus]MCZ7519664.1 heme uptake protein IsdC [Bacillus pacificus]MDA1574538.1 heme uptake protein IsdC [Bacillus cereus group sp. TH242-3LC]
MRKISVLPAFIITFVCMLAFLVMPYGKVAAQLADGTYDINYVIQKAENDSASMANDYFEKPAKLVVKNGEMRVQIPMNHSAWITEFKAPENGNFVDAKVVSKDESADKRTVEFKIDDLSKPAAAKIHVVVPNVNYDHNYTIRFAFDANVKAVGGENGAAATTKNNDQTKTGTQVKEANKETNKDTKNENGKAEKTDNPKTGDEARIGLFAVLILISGVFLIRNVKFSK